MRLADLITWLAEHGVTEDEVRSATVERDRVVLHTGEAVVRRLATEVRVIRSTSSPWVSATVDGVSLIGSME